MYDRLMTGAHKNRRKIGRNVPCPCGSGKKYKRCHGALNQSGLPMSSSLTDEIKKKLAEMDAAQKQRQKQQGLGKPIISLLHNGYRFVAVGNRLYWSDKWKSFHDFLLAYIRDALGGEWGNAELKKPFEKRHTVLQWYDRLCRYQQETIITPGAVHTAPMIGAVAAYINLAYNLYLLAHNIKIQSRLIERLRDERQFQGAHYETYVAAAFIKAGFELEFEDESDCSVSHCEFVATSPLTGTKYSVEAKSRASGKATVKIGDQLYAALRKQANHKRVIFIDINVPDAADDAESLRWLNEALADLKLKEETMTIDALPAPEAYVFLTNHPYHYSLDSTSVRHAVLSEGFKIPDFKLHASFDSLRAALRAREKHADMNHLMSSLRDHYEIPSTFDGEIPEFAFGESVHRLKIGHKYLVPGEDGIEVPGELMEAVVVESEKLVYGIYKIENGQTLIITCPLTDDELSAYRRHPDTFFGVYKPPSKRTEDPLQLYDFFFNSYHNTSIDRLLDFMKDHPDFESLKALSEEELAITYCERLVYSILSMEKEQ